MPASIRTGFHRLGWPSPTGFKLWVRTLSDNVAPVLAFTDLTGYTTFTAGGTVTDTGDQLTLTRTGAGTLGFQTPTFTGVPPATVCRFELNGLSGYSTGDANTTNLMRARLVNSTRNTELLANGTWVAVAGGQQAVLYSCPQVGIWYPAWVVCTTPADYATTDSYYVEVYHNTSGTSTLTVAGGTLTKQPPVLQLQTTTPGGTSWTTRDTQTSDFTKRDTAVLTASGLETNTAYDYRVLVDGAASSTFRTRTMPSDSGGRFVLYWISDPHDSASIEAVLDAIDTHYAAGPLADGVPAVLLLGGDFWQTLVTDVLNSGMTPEAVLYNNADNSFIETGDHSVFQRIPTLYMWDDWDYAGNNSSRDLGHFNHPTTSNANGPHTVWDWLWRDIPQQASPSRGYALSICGVPLVVPDSRSQKTPVLGGAGSLLTYTSSYNWSHPVGATNEIWGAAQRTWLYDTMFTYRESALVLFLHTHTFTDQVLPHRSPYSTVGPGVRDSTGIYHRADRNALLTELVRYGYGWRNNLLVLTGDDHWSCVRTSRLGINSSPGTTAFGDAPSGYPPPGPYPLRALEFKVTSLQSASHTAGNSPTMFGLGNWYNRSVLTQVASGNDRHNTFVVFDITSAQSGKHATARITYYVGACSTAAHAAGSIELDDNGRAGDFWFEDGYFNYYNATSTAQAQKWPTENSQEDVSTFNLTYIDDITGLPVPERHATRDRRRRLRDRRDLGAPDRDDLLEFWAPRVETPELEP